ncbi:hypothetical protein BGZ60DRAFT_107141 [Tricladium varicosporioides]|nr:hypothetical protein BGZ60DRAFT_107141 [Hymenoscyphus varicosporioides]
MSLDPRDSRTRGRSKSPGRQRDSSRSRVEVRESSRIRESSRVRRDPSPPSSRYDDPRDRGGYEYEERESIRTSTRDRERDAAIVTAEPRDSRYGSSSKYRDTSPAPGAGREGYNMPMPGAFEVEESREVRYAASGGGRAKDYYDVEKSYGGKDQYGRPTSPPNDKYGRPLPDAERSYGKDLYGRPTSPPKDKYGRPVSPPKGTKYEYEKYESDKYTYEKKDKHRGDPKGSQDALAYGDHYEDDRKERRKREERERGASFTASTGHHSIAGAINIGHDKHSSAYAQPYPTHASPPSGRTSYAEPKKWEYAQPDDKLTYSKRQEVTTTYGGRPASPPGHYSARDSHSRLSEGGYGSARSSSSKIVTVDPGSRRHDHSPNPATLAAGAGAGAMLGARMHSLSVSTGNHGGASLSLANAPGSPLLEAYHGTYQSISPMPSPLLHASHHQDVNYIEPLSPLSSDDDRRDGKKSRRTARFHDPVDEAKILANALKGEKRAPDLAPLIEILPSLSHDQVLDLRVEYKRIVKTGGKGVNIAKHIKMRLKEEDLSLMKACYACALGKWESEAYWANFWYQGEKNRRELLIESLMGRTNREIEEIKEGFSDKKYKDSLEQCMVKELKEDKFKKAILLALRGKKMEERRGEGVDRRLVEDDVHDLHKAVSEKGGETSMINIIVVRSDSHLREVLRVYEATYRGNFAREMLKKSGNLVGELLAHILNGVINKPVRDALLVHHALSLSKSDSIRTELLISRLVRYHWDRPHMEAVKREFRTRYGVDMQQAVREGTRGDWGIFCEGLCVRRMGDEVREVRRVEEYSETRVRRDR